MTKRTAAIKNNHKQAAKAAKKRSKAKQRDSGVGLQEESGSELSDLSDSASASEQGSDSESDSDDGSEAKMDEDESFDLEEAEIENKQGDSSHSDWDEDGPRKKKKLVKKKPADNIKRIWPAHIHPFDDLSEELLLNIMSNMDPPEIQAFSVTSKRFLNFTRNPSIRAEWLASKYPRNNLLFHLVKLGNLAKCSETIDKVAARQPISRYFLQRLYKARGNSQSPGFGKWGTNLSLSALANFLTKGAQLYGEKVQLKRNLTDADVFQAWLDNDGGGLRKVSRYRRMYGRRNEASDSTKEQAYETIEELFLKYKFAPFAPSDPIQDKFPAAFALRPDFHDLLIKADFVIDDKFKEGILNRTLFVDNLSVRDKVAKIKRYSNLEDLKMVFSEDHLFSLFDGCGFRGTSFLGVGEKCLTSEAVQVLKALDDEDHFEHDLSEVVVRVIMKHEGDELIYRTSHIIEFLDAFPAAAMDPVIQTKYVNCVIAILSSDLFGIYRYPASGSCAEATKNFARTFNATAAKNCLQKHSIDLNPADFMKLFDEGPVSAKALLKFASQISADQNGLQKSIIWTLMETPGQTAALSEALRMWPERLDFVKEIVLERRINKDMPPTTHVTALGFSTPHHWPSPNFHRAEISAGLATAAPFAPPSIVINLRHLRGYGRCIASVLQEHFEDDGEVLTVLLAHAALNSSLQAVSSLLNHGVYVSLELFEVLQFAKVAPIQMLFCALRRQPFCADMADCLLTKDHLLSQGRFSELVFCRPCTNLAHQGYSLDSAIVKQAHHDGDRNLKHFQMWIGEFEKLRANAEESMIEDGAADAPSPWLERVNAFLEDAKSTLPPPNSDSE